jgi:hypothetical protein
VVEGRYRPTYAERLAQLERAAPDAPPDVVSAMIKVLRARLDNGVLDPVDLSTAREHLVAGLARVGAARTGSPGPAAHQLAVLGATHRHWRHRLYWAATLVRQGRWGEVRLDGDPILRIWRRALELTARQAGSAECERLVRDWRACPQILVSRRRSWP